jgi:hypothetical protein
MQVRTKTVKEYVSDDDMVFDTEEKCIQHERKNEIRKFLLIGDNTERQITKFFDMVEGLKDFGITTTFQNLKDQGIDPCDDVDR